MDRRLRVFDSGSRVGLRGTEDLGEGLKAIFQIESGINVDNGQSTGQSGSQNLSSGFWASRDSFVGLDSNFGRLTFGKQSIYWTNGAFFQVGANYMETDLAFITGQMGRVNMFVTRASNTVQYTTPTFAGLNLVVSWTPDSSGGGTGIAATTANSGASATSCVNNGTNAQSQFLNSECVTANQQANAHIWGVRLNWAGPSGLGAQLDYATKKSTTDVNNTSVFQSGGAPKNSAVKFDIGWAYQPGAMLSGQYQWIDNKNTLAQVGFTQAGDDVKAQSWAIHWEQTFGNFQPYAEGGQVRKAKGCTVTAGAIPGVSGSTCDNTNSAAFGLGVRYLLSKRTWVYTQYNATKNEENSTTDNGGANITSGGGAGGPLPAGADPKIFTIGLFHNF